MKTKQRRPGTAPASLTNSRSAESSSLSEFRRRLSDHSALSVEKLSLARPLSPVPTLNSTRGVVAPPAAASSQHAGALRRGEDGATRSLDACGVLREAGQESPSSAIAAFNKFTLERDLDGATVLTALSTLGSGTVGGGAPFTLGSARL